MGSDAEKTVNEIRSSLEESYCEWGGFDGGISQSLQSYLRELGQLPRLTAEEQSRLAQQILEKENLWRSLLYKFVFIAQWQLEYLEAKDAGSLFECFMPSSLADEPAVEDIRQWMKLVDQLCQKRIALFNDCKEQESAEAAEDLNSELFRRKFSSDILKHGYSQLKLCSESVNESDLQILAAESAMSADEFKTALAETDQAWQELLILRQQMVEGNLRLVVRIVNQYSYRQLSVGDLVQEGNLGLMRSLEKFDFNLKHKFSTYASWWIRQSIGKAIAEQFRVIRIPAHMVSTIAAINRVEQRFILEHDRMPEVDEIASVLEMPPARVSAIRKMARQTISLQSPLSVDDNGSSLEDVLPDEQVIDPAKHISDETVKRQLEKLLAALSERERTILTMRFGLLGENVRTLQEISEHFNISRERVRQLEMQTLNKLRTPEIMRIFGSQK